MGVTIKRCDEVNIILFDGVCNLCDFSVQFVIKHDKNAYFHFAAQQSEVGQDLVKKYQLQTLDSIILIKDETSYTYSSAVIEIAKHLDGVLKYLAIFRFLPTVIRDFIYKLVAKYRYSIFGKKDVCMIPTLENEERFL
jgi:predicted DCC family thiol-disulfide oxidoreductase YuxK